MSHYRKFHVSTAALGLIGTPMLGILVGVGLLYTGGFQSAQAESPMFVIQETKQGAFQRPADPQLDHEPRRQPPSPPKASMPFVLQETRHIPAPKPTPQGPGIVGLDMLIHSQRYPVIQYVFPGTPAAQEGLRPGDTIVAVNGAQTIGKSRRQVDLMISDIPGDHVELTIARDGRLQVFRLTVMALGDVPNPVRPSFSALFPGH